MNKHERNSLTKLLTEAHLMNDRSSFTYPHPTYQFNQGYAWGIEEAMRAAGFTQAELYDIWSDARYPHTD